MNLLRKMYTNGNQILVLDISFAQDIGNTRVSHAIQLPGQLKSLADVATEPKRCKANYLHQRQSSIQCNNKAYVVDVEKDPTQCLGKGGKIGVFSRNSIPAPFDRAGTAAPFPKKGSKGDVQDQRCNDQQRTGTFASPLQQ